MYSGETMVLSDLGEGFVEWTLDAHGAPMNSLGATALKEWSQVLDVLESQSWIQGLLVSSAKSSFIAGANIKEFPALFSNTPDSVFQWARSVQGLCDRLEALPFATVAAIEGVALGGGFELALSVDRRILSHSAQLGLPEVTLGICPGWGGSVRLPRLIGLKASLPWLLDGKARNAREALDSGVADLVTQSNTLRATALNSLKALANQGISSLDRVRSNKRAPVDGLIDLSPQIFQSVTGSGKTPARTILKAVEVHCTLPFEEALKREAECFCTLAKGNDASALIGLFISEQRLKKRAKKVAEGAASTRSAAVVGAGLMGGGIAYQSAINNVPVTVRDISQEALDLGLNTAKALLKAATDKGRLTTYAADQSLARISTTRTFEGFDRADVVIEAVVEKFEVKRAVLMEIEAQTSIDAVLTSNTSTISISSLAEGLQRPSQFCGMHFFNPVPLMPLVEVVRGRQSSSETIARIVNFALALGKKPIVVEDCPGFLINRILFPYFNAFNRLLLEGVSFERIDEVMENFGWPMGPAYLADVIGLDTMVNADKVLQAGFPERMAQPKTVFVELLLECGHVGKKGGSGFYEYGSHSKKPSAMAMELINPSVRAEMVSEQEIIERLMVPLCSEALRCLDEGIVETADDIDIGAIMGLGFPRFRGGPLRYMEAVGLAEFAQAIRRHSGISKLYVIPEGLTLRIENSENIH